MKPTAREIRFFSHRLACKYYPEDSYIEIRHGQEVIVIKLPQGAAVKFYRSEQFTE